MTGEIATDFDDRRCTITISNPAKRNALTPAMIADLVDAFRGLGDRDDVRVVVLTGAGSKAFCSGFDIDEFDGDGLEKEGAVADLLQIVEETDRPTVARINGDAVGAGFELVTACDLRLAAADARFGIPPARIGIIPSDRAIGQLLAAIGPTYAKELLFTAELVGAERAAEIGLLNDVVDRAALDERTDELTERISANAPLSIRGMKSIVRAMGTNERLSANEKEWVRSLQEEAFDSRDHAEGRAAFREKRQPEFEGR